MMKNECLKAILALSVFGMLFSGYLSYGELFTSSGAACSVASVKILGLPACVYGFVMYAIILALSWLGLKSRK